MVKRQQPFSQRLIICHRHWHYSISTSIKRSHLCYKSIINYDLDITNILVVSPQIRYIEVFDITNPPFNEQIWPVPSDFVNSRFHCIAYTIFLNIPIYHDWRFFFSRINKGQTFGHAKDMLSASLRQVIFRIPGINFSWNLCFMPLTRRFMPNLRSGVFFFPRDEM